MASIVRAVTSRGKKHSHFGLGCPLAACNPAEPRHGYDPHFFVSLDWAMSYISTSQTEFVTTSEALSDRSATRGIFAGNFVGMHDDFVWMRGGE